MTRWFVPGVAGATDSDLAVIREGVVRAPSIELASGREGETLDRESAVNEVLPFSDI